MTALGLVGADGDQMRTLARTLNHAAERLEGMAGEVTGRMSSAAWTGPDADRYRSHWHGESLAQLRGVVGALRSAAVTVERNVVEQDQASAATGVTGPTAAGANMPAGDRATPINPLVDIRNFLSSNALWPLDWGTAIGLTPTGSKVSVLSALGWATDESSSAQDRVAGTMNSATDIASGMIKDKGGWVGYLGGVAVAQWGDVAANVVKADFSADTLKTTGDYITKDPGGAFNAAKDAVVGYIPKLFSNFLPPMPWSKGPN